MLTKDKIKRFEASLKRSVKERIQLGFIKTYKPVINDAPYRSFETMAEYKKWCNKLPKFLGMYQYQK